MVTGGWPFNHRNRTAENCEDLNLCIPQFIHTDILFLFANHSEELLVSQHNIVPKHKLPLFTDWPRPSIPFPSKRGKFRNSRLSCIQQIFFCFSLLFFIAINLNHFGKLKSTAVAFWLCSLHEASQLFFSFPFQEVLCFVLWPGDWDTTQRFRHHWHHQNPKALKTFSRVMAINRNVFCFILSVVQCSTKAYISIIGAAIIHPCQFYEDVPLFGVHQTHDSLKVQGGKIICILHLYGSTHPTGKVNIPHISPKIPLRTATM